MLMRPGFVVIIVKKYPESKDGTKTLYDYYDTKDEALQAKMKFIENDINGDIIDIGIYRPTFVPIEED